MIRDFIKECMLFQTTDRLNIATGIYHWMLILFVIGIFTNFFNLQILKKLKIKLKKPSSSGVFHDTRGDVRRLAEVCNILIDKCNELVEEVNQLKKQQVFPPVVNYWHGIERLNFK